MVLRCLQHKLIWIMFNKFLTALRGSSLSKSSNSFGIPFEQRKANSGTPFSGIKKGVWVKMFFAQAIKCLGGGTGRCLFELEFLVPLLIMRRGAGVTAPLGAEDQEPRRVSASTI